MGGHGLVLGKFYPPHAGHELLIRTAAAACDQVSVVVLAASAEDIPLEHRIDWMRRMFVDAPNVSIDGAIDDVVVDYQSDIAWQGHVAITQSVLQKMQAPPVTHVFTSESYGDELARRMNARHVLVDMDREHVSISGTRIRANLAGTWSMLSTPVKEGLALRVVLVGAESTGKSTIVSVLGDRLRARGGTFGLTREVYEFGRDYTIRKLTAARAIADMEDRPRPDTEDIFWNTEDFMNIARTQQRLENEAARSGSAIVLGDTDAFATCIWHERYMGDTSKALEALAPAPFRRLYLLAHHNDTPFVDDGVRDGRRIRPWMTERFIEALNQHGYKWHMLPGPREERLAFALNAIDEALPLSR